MLAFACLVLLGLAGPASDPPHSPAQLNSPDKGPFAFVGANSSLDYDAHAHLNVVYADVVAVVPRDPATRQPIGGVRIYDIKTRKKIGEAGTDVGVFEGFRGDDGLFVLHAGDGPARRTSYLNKTGKVVRTLDRSCASFFEKRAACRRWGVGRGWLEHYVDDKGNEIMPPRYWQTERFRDGQAVVAFHPTDGSEELWFTIIDRQGKPKFRPAYKTISPFFDELAYVEAADDPAHRGYIDRKGTLVVALAVDETGDPFENGVAVVRGPDGERVVNKLGKTVLRIPRPFRIYGSFTKAMSASLFGDLRSGYATVDLVGNVTNIPELWTVTPAWPPSLGKAPTTPARPRDMGYQALEQTTLKSGDANKCTDAAASMVAISKGADPAAWTATERCAKLSGDTAKAADAHAAFLYVSGLDPGVKRTREAWASLAGPTGAGPGSGRIPTR